jgi:8-hydroxy-5-deazaflavin:NADPH oxidoreductase
MDVAIVGGTGAEGFGLALRLAAAGHLVTIGSRDADRGAEAATRATDTLVSAGREPVHGVRGTANDEAAAGADVVAVTVPFAGQAEIYRSIAASVRAGTIVVDATSPLATAVGGRPWQVVRPWHGSAAEQAAALLGEGPRVVAALHTIAAHALAALERPLDSDVLVCGDDADAKATVGTLIDDIPDLRWVDCGTLSMARITETLTALLVNVNRTYKTKEAGFRIVGEQGWGAPP